MLSQEAAYIIDNKEKNRKLEKQRESCRNWYRKTHSTKSARRDRYLKKKYKITSEQWNDLFEAQQKRCRICRSQTPRSKKGWNTDHCHRTGKVRFILCQDCNQGIAAFKESPDILRRAADAIEFLCDKKSAG